MFVRYTLALSSSCVGTSSSVSRLSWAEVRVFMLLFMFMFILLALSSTILLWYLHSVRRESQNETAASPFLMMRSPTAGISTSTPSPLLAMLFSTRSIARATDSLLWLAYMATSAKFSFVICTFPLVWHAYGLSRFCLTIPLRSIFPFPNSLFTTNTGSLA